MHRSSAYPWTYLESLISGAREAAAFGDVRCYAMFIGQPRSGTSLVGSLLNAHRYICMAQELNALRYLKRGYGRNQLYWLLQRRDVEFAQRGRRWTGYDYSVPGQWQGRVEELQVIGDKKAGLSSETLGAHPDLLIRLQHVVRVPIRIFHVVRNPFNVIATIHRKRNRTPLPLAAAMYFSRCATNGQLMQDGRWDVKTFRLEQLISRPAELMSELCQFLDVPPDRDYLEACQLKLFDQPRQSQKELPWPAPLVDSVYCQMQDYPFLQGYEFQGHTTKRAA